MSAAAKEEAACLPSNKRRWSEGQEVPNPTRKHGILTLEGGEERDDLHFPFSILANRSIPASVTLK